MPTQSIPFAPNQQSGLDSLNAAVALAINVIIDKSGVVRRRPGISAYAGAPDSAVDEDGIDGVHVTVDGKVYVIGGTVGARKVYRVAGGSAFQLSGVSQGELVGQGRPVFAETEAMVVIAAGGVPQKVLLATDESSRLGGSPPDMSHVVANTSRLVGNDISSNKNRLNYSDLAAGSSTTGHETWTGGDSGFVTAEGRPDPIVAVGDATNEVFLFGTTSLQVVAPSSDEVYSKVSTVDVGCSAPYTVVRYDNTFFWLDNKRRIVRSDGRQLDVVGEQIQSTLDEIEDVSDAYAFVVNEGPCNAIVFVFPSDGRSFAYQIDGGWSLWLGYGDSTYNRQPISAVALNSETGQNIAGLADGRVGVVDMDTGTDLGDLIPVSITTGMLNRGTDALKQCMAVRLSFRRGTVDEGEDEPVAHLSWRDDEGEWSPSIEIGLGAAGDRNPVVSLRSLGTYRRRQWRIEFDGSSDFVLAGASEDFMVVEG